MIHGRREASRVPGERMRIMINRTLERVDRRSWE
jgi:hypothetical protein